MLDERDKTLKMIDAPRSTSPVAAKVKRRIRDSTSSSGRAESLADTHELETAKKKQAALKDRIYRSLKAAEVL